MAALSCTMSPRSSASVLVARIALTSALRLPRQRRTAGPHVLVEHHAPTDGTRVNHKSPVNIPCL